MCGLPSSGKTTRAKEIAALLEQSIQEHNASITNSSTSSSNISNNISANNSNSNSLTLKFGGLKRDLRQVVFQPKVIIINEESLSINRSEAYSS